MISEKFGQQLLDFLVPEKIDYSNLTVYENTAGLLTSLLTSSGIYIKNTSGSSVSLIEGVPQKAAKFLEHLQTQNKVT